MKRPTQSEIDDAIVTLVATGHVVLREKSYRQAQERQRVAQAQAAWEQEERRGTQEWARQAFDEQRRLADRLTFVYGVARARGATVEELTQ